MPKKLNWERIFDDFVTTGLSYDQLASRHGCSRQAIEGRAAKENWQSRRRAIVSEKNASQSLPVSQEQLKQELPEVQISSIDGTGQLNLNSLVSRALVRAGQELEVAQSRSFEKSAEGFCEISRLYLELNPPTPKQWAEAAFNYRIHPAKIIEEMTKLLREAGQE